MSTNTALDDIKARVEGHTEGPWRTWQHGGGPRNSGVETTWAHEGDEPVQVSDWCFPGDAELIAAAPKLLAALEAVEALAAEHSARIPFPDADKESQWYSLGKQHGYERVLFEIQEALK